MRLLLDTQLLLWASLDPNLLPVAAFTLMNDAQNELLFSALSIWEVAIKSAQRRGSFQVDTRFLLRGLLDGGYTELPITSQHAVNIDALPTIHKDPFDRLLPAQAISEVVTLLTADALLAQYPGPVRLV